MAKDEQNPKDLVIRAAKIASAERLLAKLETAHRQGKLRPIGSNAKPQVLEVRGKSKKTESSAQQL